MRWQASIPVGILAGLMVSRLWAFPADQDLLLAILRSHGHMESLSHSWRVAGLILLHSPMAFNRIRLLWTVLSYAAPWAGAFLVLSGGKQKAGKLPEYTAPEHREEFSVVLGEVHERLTAEPSSKPTWLVVPEAGLWGGLQFTGMTGAGKTVSGVEPVVEQLIGFKAGDEAERCSGLFLEVKGDFGAMVSKIAKAAGRADDVRCIGEWHYSALPAGLKSAELGAAISKFMVEAGLTGGKLEAPFWGHAGSSLCGNAVEAQRLAGEVPTLSTVFRLIGDPDAMRRKIDQADERIAGGLTYTFSKDVMRRFEKKLKNFDPVQQPDGSWHIPYSPDLHLYCHPEDDPASRRKPWGGTHGEVRRGGLPDAKLKRRLDTLQFSAEKVWRQIPKEEWARISLGVSETLKLFEDPDFEEVYCPKPDDPKLLPSMDELMDTGKLVVVKYSVADEKVSRLIATMLKLDYYRAIESRSLRPGPYRRSLFVCDEYQKLASHKDVDFGALCRQMRCARIISYPGCDVLAEMVGIHWRSMFSSCNSRVFLGANDMTTAEEASKLCGKRKVRRQNQGISQQPGRNGSSASVSHSEVEEPMFKPDEFINLPVGQAIALVWDGSRRIPATRLHLKSAAVEAEERYGRSVFA